MKLCILNYFWCKFSFFYGARYLSNGSNISCRYTAILKSLSGRAFFLTFFEPNHAKISIICSIIPGNCYIERHFDFFAADSYRFFYYADLRLNVFGEVDF